MTEREPSLDAWWDEHGHEIAEARAFVTDPLPDDPALRCEHVALAVALESRMGFLANEMESVATSAHADAIIAIRSRYSECSAQERAVLAKAWPALLQATRMRDDLAVLVRTLRGKAIAAQNINNTLDRRTGQ